MVWRADESPLYKSVEKFNMEAHPRESEKQPKQSCSADSGKGACCPGPEPCRANPEAPPPLDPAPKQCGQANNRSFISRLAGDRDFLLIGALIFLLWHEKADIKLIAALVYVLLG